jgi:hypothetical protein
MPSQIIHVLAGRAALSKTENLSFAFHDSAFTLGCQGPDIFSHNRRTKPFALSFSRLLHRHDYAFFCRNFAKLLLAEPSSLAASWFLGFVTHQHVDRVLHPYIVFRSFITGSTGIPGVPPTRFHVFLERILDALLLEHLEGTHVSAFDTGNGFALSEPDYLCLSRMIASALLATYPVETNEAADLERRVANAFIDAMYFYEITNPVEVTMKKTAKNAKLRQFHELGVDGVSLLYPESLPDGVDWLNVRRGEWRHPVTGETTNNSVPDLFAQAVNDAVSEIRKTLRVLSLEIAPEAYISTEGNSCLSVCGKDGKIGTVLFAEPFDFAPVLLDQAEKRRVWISNALS